MNQSIAIHPQSDYDAVRAAIAYLSQTPADALDLESFARALGLTQRQLTDLFRRWCGLSPKSFAQAVALDHARQLLDLKASVLDTTFEVGLSSTSRLHDLFVTYEAMPPGAYRERGAGLNMRWGVAPSPFGEAILVLTDYGLAGLGFTDEIGREASLEDFRRRWPNAQFVRDDKAVAPYSLQVFDPARWEPDKPVRVVLIGTDFQVRVWETLLKIPCGRAVTYGDLAEKLGKPTASRAVGAAVGRNPVSFVVPCHRVVGSKGSLTGYHWGLARKRAILGWEAGVTAG
jgi:AraC family transcriptional regulator, regulatory protein of adaptative response / methylated-DNA-[protein]-cysteine methyltransferase